MRIVAPGLVLALFAASAQAQSEFHFNLSGDAEVPPVSTRAGGYGRVILNSDLTVDYFVTTWRISGTTAAVYHGFVDGKGQQIFRFQGGPTTWHGHAGPITTLDRDVLLAGRCFVRVTSLNYPGGEIRGQALPSPTDLAALLSGGQVVPPVTTTATANAVFEMRPDLTLSYHVSAVGLTGTAAHVRIGRFGSNGPASFDLVGGPTDWQGVSPVLPPDDFAAFQSMGAYVDVDTAANPSGEIRGQIIVTETPYGPASPSTLGDPRLHAIGEPTPGGHIDFQVTNAVPNGQGLIIVASDIGAIATGDINFLVGGTLVLIPTVVDSTGVDDLLTVVPDLTGFVNPLDVHVQFFGIDPAMTPRRIYATNAILVSLVQF